jgi:hypothetical protein
MRAWIEMGSAALTLCGVVAGVYGTFLMTKFYHPYGLFGFLASVIRSGLHRITGQKKKQDLHLEIETAFGGITKEKRGESLYGIQWVFIGFFLQTVGAILILLDTWILNRHPSWFHITGTGN